MYKKLKEIFNWFQQKAIRRMNLKNVLNEYYYRMDSSGLPTSGTMYKRQAVVYREKTIDDWIMSVTAATDPDDPRRGLLYRFFQSLYNDEHLQTTIDNRVLPVQQAKYNLVDDNDNEDEEAKNYWIVHGFTSLSESVFCISYRGYHLPIFPTLMIIWKLAMSKKFPCQITFHNNKSSSGRNQTRLDGRTKTVRLNRTMYNSVIRGRWGCSTNWRSSFLPRN